MRKSGDNWKLETIAKLRPQKLNPETVAKIIVNDNRLDMTVFNLTNEQVNKIAPFITSKGSQRKFLYQMKFFSNSSKESDLIMKLPELDSFHFDHYIIKPFFKHIKDIPNPSETMVKIIERGPQTDDLGFSRFVSKPFSRLPQFELRHS